MKIIIISPIFSSKGFLTRYNPQKIEKTCRRLKIEPQQPADHHTKTAGKVLIGPTEKSTDQQHSSDHDNNDDEPELTAKNKCGTYMSYSLDFKLAVIRELHESDVCISSVSSKYNLPWSTIHSWECQLRQKNKIRKFLMERQIRQNYPSVFNLVCTLQNIFQNVSVKNDFSRTFSRTSQ